MEDWAELGAAFIRQSTEREKRGEIPPRDTCPLSNPMCDGYGTVQEDDGVRVCECAQKALAARDGSE